MCESNKDIKERLRASSLSAMVVRHEAADEIERLNRDVMNLEGYLATQRDEIERLQAALNNIEQNARTPGPDPGWKLTVVHAEIARLTNTIKNCPPVSESEYVRRLEDEVKQLKADNSRLCVDLFELSKTKGIEETARLQAIIASTRLPNCGCGRNEVTVQLLKGSS